MPYSSQTPSTQGRAIAARRAGIVLPPMKFVKKLKAGRYAKVITKTAGVYMAAVLEYAVAELLELAGNAARDLKKQRITPRHIKLAVMHDDELDRLVGKAVFAQGGGNQLGIRPELLLPAETKKKARVFIPAIRQGSKKKTPSGKPSENLESMPI